VLPPSAGEAMLRPRSAQSMALGCKSASMACALQKFVFPVQAITCVPCVGAILVIALGGLPVLHRNSRETPAIAASIPCIPTGIVPVYREGRHTVSAKQQPLASHPAATQGEPPLSPQLAFVVQFREGPAPWTGRVEHVTSGRAARFRSVEELWAFMTRVVGEGAEQSPEEESGDRES